MIHTSDVSAALDWYSMAFPKAERRRDERTQFEFLLLNGVQIECVPVDQKSPAGPGGSVVYWRTDNFAATLDHMLAIGARLYRGPMQIEDGLSMCQVQDPWGNCIGIRGPSDSSVG
ncbi:MAG: glyoxalase/bleomycin resistance/dioxygenase family protein [Betaproteobacteria bacterium]|nr:glyoxalase/bleomycin resistance/dioxygenase family protein [Betaproteobacteria bacterium]